MFITDANDEKPEFLNLPFIVDVPEVGMRVLQHTIGSSALTARS